MSQRWNYYQWAQRCALRMTQDNGSRYMDNLAAYMMRFPYHPHRFPHYVIYDHTDAEAIDRFLSDYEEYKSLMKLMA